MAIYTDRIVLVFPIAAKNRRAAASLQTLEITESGKEFELLIPLDPELVKDYASEFNLGWETEKVALVEDHKAELSKIQTELTAANATIADQNSAVSNQAGTIIQLQADLAEKESLIASKNNQLDTLAAAINAQVDLTKDLQAKVETLKQNQRFDPKQINAKAFYNRITKDEFAQLSASDDPQLTAIAKAILAYAANDKIWPVVFESPEMQGMLGYLLAAKFLSQERVSQLTQDASWQEAFYAA